MISPLLLKMTTNSKNSNIQDIYPLSHTQSGLLFHTLYQSQAGTYLDQLLFTITADLDTVVFHQAWQEVIDRHPILRTIFLWEDRRQPLQVVRKVAQIELQELDWRGEKETGLQDFLDRDRQRGFDLMRAPLMRLALIRTGERDYEFIWTYHYLILDGWCLPLLIRDFIQSYEAILEGNPVRLPAPPPYRNYISWLRKQDLGAAQRFWQTYLAGFSAPTPLPPSYGHKEDCGFGHRSFRLSYEHSRELENLARSLRLTPNTILQGAWALLLSRYSGEKDVVFGATVSGRPAELPAVEKMIGVFINTLPVRVRVDESMQLGDWLHAIQSGQAPVRTLEFSPLVEVQGWSGVPRGQPLFESILVFSNYPRDVPFLEGIDSALKMDNFRAIEQNNYPLSILITPGDQWRVWIDYDRRRISDHAVSRLADHLQTLITNIVSDPQTPLGSLDWVTAGEKRQVLQAWNDTGREEVSLCLHQLVEAQAARTPDLPAVSGDDGRLSYGELNRRADRLASRLRSLGVAPDVLVGLCAGRGVQMLVGLLAILKAGGAYVPIDPEYPRSRIEYMIADSGIRVILTQSDIQPSLESLASSPALIALLDGDSCAGGTQVENEKVALSPDNLAYVIHTSGSTGNPKGVQIPHRAVVNLMRSMQSDIGLRPEDTLLAVTTLSFDIAALELFLPLTIGAQVVIASRETAMDAMKLAAQMEEASATAMQATPATWQMLVENGWPGKPGLKILCGGEALRRDLAEDLLGKGESLLNLYGPTETTIWSTAYPVQSGRGPLPIGRPIDNTQIYILDAGFEPLPAGASGDLYIAGAGLARGYLNRPGQTAGSFFPDPFSPPGKTGRMYRTGDRARWRPDGQVEFLGRDDFQVKVRGFRVELGEIEIALRSHPDIDDAVAMVREDRPGDQRLVGYLVAANAARPEAMRQFLQEKLPEHMLPNQFMFLSRFPLTPNGKIDRKALPVPDARASGDGFEAPKNERETAIAAIFAEVLGLEKVGRQHSFFELGGHSLLAMQVISRFRVIFNNEVDVQVLFDTPRVADLARVFDRREELDELEEILRGLSGSELDELLGRV